MEHQKGKFKKGIKIQQIMICSEFHTKIQIMKKTMKQTTKDVHVYIPPTFPLLYLSAFLVFASVEGQVTYLQTYCSDNGNYNQGSEYQNNLDLLFSNLTTKTNSNKFYNFTAGETPNNVYGLFLCNGVNNSDVCQDCVSIAAGEIQRRCPSSVEAIVWYMECMVRYANYSVFSTDDVSVHYDFKYGPTKYGQFNQRLSETFIGLFHQASIGNSSLKSAVTAFYVTGDVEATCYVDCTPDLSPQGCNRCLQTALGQLLLDGNQAGILLQPSCRLMYGFSDTGSRSPGKGLYIALGIISAVAVASLMLNVFVCLKRRNANGKPTGLDEIESMENLHFQFDAIKSATDSFSAANKVGQGGFGVVYMGTLADGQPVAVKRLSNASRQGIKEFKMEACLAAKLQHKNLVKLYGFCLESEEMLLVYEFVPNKSLDRYLFDTKRGGYLSWETRYKIIVGIARGLSYLHEDSRPKIIHRDLKPSNILLDGEMNPKIADFGMAKLFAGDQTQGNTSRVAGTFGYMAPEYTTTGHFSIKSDIFSYGVIILEIISGLRNSCSDPEVQDENLLNYAWRLWNEGTYQQLVDSAMGSHFSATELERCIRVGLMCVQEDPTKRPKSASVLLMLNPQPNALPPLGPPPPFPYRPEKPAVLHESNGAQAEEMITDLSPR